MKLFEKIMNKQFASWIQVDLLTQLPDFSSFFPNLVCLFMQKKNKQKTHMMNEDFALSFRLRLPGGDTQHKKVSRKIKSEAQFSRETLDFSPLYIVFETVDYQHIVFIIIISHLRL